MIFDVCMLHNEGVDIEQHLLLCLWASIRSVQVQKCEKRASASLFQSTFLILFSSCVVNFCASVSMKQCCQLRKLKNLHNPEKCADFKGSRDGPLNDFRWKRRLNEPRGWWGGCTSWIISYLQIQFNDNILKFWVNFLKIWKKTQIRKRWRKS